MSFRLFLEPPWSAHKGDKADFVRVFGSREAAEDYKRRHKRRLAAHLCQAYASMLICERVLSADLQAVVVYILVCRLEPSVVSRAPLSLLMEEALGLLREHGELYRWIDGCRWTPKVPEGGRPAYFVHGNHAMTTTIRALVRRGLVYTDLGDMRPAEVFSRNGHADQRARLVKEAVDA